MKQAASTNLVQPPEDAFWQRYSPHHEFPVSCVGAVFAHAAVIGLLVVSGLGIWWIREETSRPASMDVVMLAGGNEGLGGLGGIPGLPGSGGAKSEFVPETPGAPASKPETKTPVLQDVPKNEFTIPDVPMGQTPLDDEVLRELAALSKDAAKVQNVVPPKDPGTGNKPSAGTTGQKNSGPGGKGTTGDGPNSGAPGQGGTNGIGGSPRKMSKREIFAARWRFDLTGSPRQHAEKLAAAGVIVVVPDPAGQRFLRIEDLKRRPVAVTPIMLPKFEDAVQWRNQDANSVSGLAQELRLPYVPAFVVLLLPQSREMKMADAEAEFAERNGRDLKTVQATLFDFRLQNGKYEPVVLTQQ